MSFVTNAKRSIYDINILISCFELYYMFQASLRKATNVNLSTNLLVSLPVTFVTLKQIVKLDLSRNMLVELPENFGEMTQLKHLDLYANKVKNIFFL